MTAAVHAGPRTQQSVDSGRVEFVRTYRDGALPRAAGTFAHAVVLASVEPSDWQVGQDAARVAAALVERAAGGTSVTVSVAVDLVAEHIEVSVRPEGGHTVLETVVPRRPFRTSSSRLAAISARRVP